MEANILFSRVDADVIPSETSREITSNRTGEESAPNCWHMETLAAEGAPKSRGCAPSYMYRPNLVPEANPCFQPK